jgi:hypothetical protein
MKKKLSLSIQICVMILISISCTKDNLKDPVLLSLPLPKLRITMMSDNQDMTDPFVFTYDSVGLLSRMSNEWSCYDEIEYNANKQPSKIKWFQYVNSEPLDTWATDIEWISEGIMLKNSAPGKSLRDLYKLNAENKITAHCGINEDINGIPDTTIHIKYFWYGNDSLKIEQRSMVGDPVTGPYYEELFAQYIKFGKQKSPFEGINIALLYKLNYSQYVTGNVSDFCVSEYKNFHAIEIGRAHV